MKGISASGFSPNAMWMKLSYMRDQLPSTSGIWFPDPAPLTRAYSMRKSEAVTQPIQLVPVLVGLINSAIKGASIREEIENGIRDMKDRNRVYYAAVKAETDRWQAEKEKLQEQEVKNKERKKWDEKKWAGMVIILFQHESFAYNDLTVPDFASKGQEEAAGAQTNPERIGTSSCARSATLCTAFSASRKR